MDQMTDRERILALLERRGPTGATTFELRREGYTGNPSQRVNELREAGHKIDAEPFVRDDGRRGSRYILRQKERLF